MDMIFNPNKMKKTKKSKKQKRHDKNHGYYKKGFQSKYAKKMGIPSQREKETKK